MKPLVSVVLPTYNRGPRVKATIDSVLSQTLPGHEYELIVIDDGSSDDTADFIARTYGGNEQVRLVRQANQGVAAARNKGLGEARGEYLAYLDHDDCWLPEKLEAQLAAFKAAPPAAVVYCYWEEVDEEGHPLPAAQQMTQLSGREAPAGWVYDALVPHNFMISMSVPLVKTAALREAGGFDPDTVPCDDWDLWLRLARRHEFACVPRVLVRYTRHALQQSNAILRMNRGEQRALIKQWPYHLTKPRKLWMVLCRSSFLKTAPLYFQAKERLCAARSLWWLLCRVALLHPLALFSPQWLYFLRRLAARDRRPY